MWIILHQSDAASDVKAFDNGAQPLAWYKENGEQIATFGIEVNSGLRGQLEYFFASSRRIYDDRACGWLQSRS
jgi:hypothetical protein